MSNLRQEEPAGSNLLVEEGIFFRAKQLHLFSFKEKWCPFSREKTSQEFKKWMLPRVREKALSHAGFRTAMEAEDSSTESKGL